MLGPRSAEIDMPRGLDRWTAKHIVSSAMSSLYLPRGRKVTCTRDALRAALLAAVRDAYEIGFLEGQKEPRIDLTRYGDAGRTAWREIRLDDPADLAKHHIRIKPVVLQSLADAGYRCLGDLCFVPDRQLRDLHYVGIKTARSLRAIVRRFQEAESASQFDRRDQRDL